MPVRESQLQRVVLKRLGVALPGAVVRKRHGSPFGKAGDPDIYVLSEGCHLEFELKRPGEAATRLQQHRLDEWRKAGAQVAVIHTVEELDEFLSSLYRAGYITGYREP